MGLVLLILLLLLVVSALPIEPWTSWHHLGWAQGGIGLVFVIVLLGIVLSGRW